ncbi:MAG: ABC transporter ATP-binding protein, partial [Fibrella sp.]|nr:ABC transporter ATP-binding protein [Armatimonadota bacterium]
MSALRTPTEDTFSADLSDEPVLIREVADLVAEENHCFGKREVVVTLNRVAVFDEAGVQLLSVPMSGIKTARTESLVGGARLELSLHTGDVLPVAEFTASVAARFSEMARGIEQLAKGEELAIKLTQEKTRCDKCGRLLPEKDGKCAACVKRMAVFGRVLNFLSPYKVPAFWVTFGSLASAVIATFAQPWLVLGLTDRLLNMRPRPTLEEGVPQLAFYVGGLTLALLGNTLFGWLKSNNGAYLAANIAKDLRGQTYAALERLQLGFFDKKQIGAIISRITQDTERIWGFLADGVPYLLVGSLTIVMGLASGLLLSWKLSLAILLPVPLVAGLGSLIWKPLSSKYYKVGQRWGRLHTQLNESLNGIRVVKAFVQEDGEYEKFAKHNTGLASAATVADRWWAQSEAAMNFLIGWAPLINWGYGGYLVLRGEITYGTLMAMQILLWQVYGPLAWFGQVNQWFSKAMAGAERVFEVIDAQPEGYQVATAQRMPEMRGDVTFDKVRFGYDKSNPVLKGVELEVKAGEMIGLVGKSGAGKSTTMNLLCRFYEADAGSLMIDGVDIKDIALDDLRRHIGIVLQEPFLFNG